MISNDFSGKDNYCKGGQVYHALNNFAYNMSTVDLSSNHEYDPKTDKNLDDFAKKVAHPTQIPEKHHYLPFKILEDQYVQ